MTPEEERLERIMKWHLDTMLFGSASLSQEDFDWLKTHSLEGTVDVEALLRARLQ